MRVLAPYRTEQRSLEVVSGGVTEGVVDLLVLRRFVTEQLAGDLRRLASEVRPLLPPAKRGDATDH